MCFFKSEFSEKDGDWSRHFSSIPVTVALLETTNPLMSLTDNKHYHSRVF